jgi:hypothetical protein
MDSSLLFMKTTHCTLLALAFLYLLFPGAAFSQNTNVNTLLGDNSRWTIDMASRISRNTNKQENSFMQTIGIDIHKIFSGKTSDIGTLVFQPYIVKLNNMGEAPFYFDHINDTQLTWRIANFNYTALNQGKFNIRIGHFEIPYGLEYQIDTNGTLRQLTTSDRGIKADWGVSVNGILSNVEYEVALTRGSGNEIKSKENPHIFSGRIGTSTNKNIVTGISWFTGDVLNKNGVTKRRKIGIDGSYYYYQWQFMAEYSIGKTAHNNTVNGFVEALWKNARESLSTYIQVGYQSTEINHKVSSKTNSTSYWLTGVQWLSNTGFDISAQYKHKLKNTSELYIDPIVSIQLRYRM